MENAGKTVAGLVLCLGAGFLAGGAWWNRSTPSPQAAVGTRRILYYHDPMHPAYKSDKPGIAPDCGMRLEPVYADGGAAVAPAAANGKVLSDDISTMEVGTVQITPEK